MRFTFFAPILLSLAACSTLSLNGKVENNRYYSPNNELSVEVPAVAEKQAKDGQNGTMHYVDFIPGGHYWMMDHAYSIEWFTLTKPADKHLLITGLPQMMKKNFESSAGKLDNPVCKFISIHGTTAARCVSQGIRDNTSAGYVGTSLIINGRLVNAYVIYPSQKMQMPSASYDHFINSISIKN